MESVRVLLIDDSPRFVDSLTQFLKQQDDIVVVGRANGEQKSLEQSRDLGPQVALVDLGTPGLSGLDAIAHVRATMPDVGIIVMSMVHAAGYEALALASGADCYLPKAALVTELLPAIRGLLKGNTARQRCRIDCEGANHRVRSGRSGENRLGEAKAYG